MGCCLGCLACQAASCACSGLCSCFSAIPVAVVLGRLMYAISFFVMSMIAWVFHAYSKQLLDKIPVLQRCSETAAQEGQQVLCYGTLAVYRISFVLVVFHLILAVMMIGVKYKGDARTGIQDGWWLIKLAFLVLGSVGVFFIPNPFFEVFGWIALVASGIFIIIQLLLFIDFAHSWAEKWIGNLEESEDGDRRWFWALMGATGVLYLICIALVIVMSYFFASDPAACQANVAFISINVILCFAIGILSIHPRVQESSPKSGLLQAAFISTYATYLVFSAMMSSTDSCNPWQSQIESSGTTNASNISIAIGAAFTVVAVCYTTIRAASTVGEVVKMEDEVAPLVKAENGEHEGSDVKSTLAATEADATHSDPKEPVTYNFTKFHIIFALGAFYIAMLMSDWTTVYDAGQSSASVDSGLASVWVKIVSGWICIGIYIWTLVAPIIFPDRDFS